MLHICRVTACCSLLASGGKLTVSLSSTGLAKRKLKKVFLGPGVSTLYI